MDIWIVSMGEMHEGSTVQGVYSSANKARSKVLELENEAAGPWVPTDTVKTDLVVKTAGCDYIEMRRYEVD